MKDEPRPDPTDAPVEIALFLAAFEASRQGDIVALEGLLDRHVPPDSRNEHGDTLLMLACHHGHFEVARLLLERGADPDVLNERDQTPLLAAAFRGDHQMAKLLLDHGAFVDGTGDRGRTPLMFAAMLDRVEVMDLLLTRGASRGEVDATGDDALGIARAMGALRAEARLLGRYEATRTTSAN